MHHPRINEDYKLYLQFQSAFKFAVVQFTSVMPAVEFLGSLFINF